MKKKTFKKNKKYVIDLKNYRKDITYLDEDLIFFSQLEKNKCDVKRIEAFARYWLLFIHTDPTVQISVRNGSKLLSIDKPSILFLPPFNITEWHIKSNHSFKWEAFISTALLPKNLPKDPIIFPFVLKKPLRNYDEIIKLIQAQVNNKHCIVVETQKENSILALRVKETLDQYFTKNLNISDVSKKLNASRTSVSTSFKKAYGLSPIEYRHLLRIFEALRLINEGFSVADALLNSGFKDHAQFIKHFKRVLQTTPNKYSPSLLELK